MWPHNIASRILVSWKGRVQAVQKEHISNQCIPNQWIVFFTRSDWLLKLAIISAIHLPALSWISRASFPSFLRKQSNYFVLTIHWFDIYLNNHSPQCRWRVVDIYLATSQLGNIHHNSPRLWWIIVSKRINTFPAPCVHISSDWQWLVHSLQQYALEQPEFLPFSVGEVVDRHLLTSSQTSL